MIDITKLVHDQKKYTKMNEKDNMNKKDQKKESKSTPALHSIISDAGIPTTSLLSLNFVILWQTA